MATERRRWRSDALFALAAAVVLATAPGCDTGGAGRDEVERIVTDARQTVAAINAEADAAIGRLEAELERASATPGADPASMAAMRSEVERLRAEVAERSSQVMAAADGAAQAVLAAMREDGSIDAVGAVGPLIPFLPAPVGAAVLGVAALGNVVQEVVRRRKERALEAALREAGKNRAISYEIVHSMDALRERDPGVRSAMAIEENKIAMHKALSPEAFEFVEKVRNT